jgi:hypothetical protein
MVADPEYQSLVDTAGTVGQFLLNTGDDDLVIELIQNELDARSSRTRIQVHNDCLVCEGNGRNIGRRGWDRMKYILGAGSDVSAKKSGIGAKNHGLRLGFRLGDNIHIQSGGKRTQLTTRANVSKSRFAPGALKAAVDDPTAPTAGTRVSVSTGSKGCQHQELKGSIFR